MTHHDRLTSELIFDVMDVLERHGYHQYDHRHTGQAIGAILDLAYVYDGTRDLSHATYAPSAPHTAPAPSGPGEDEAHILTNAEVRTVVAALDIAADYKRDRAAGCANCADQACPTCQSRLRDAQAYDQMATQMLHTTRVSRTTSTGQRQCDDPLAPPARLDPEAGREAG